MNRKLKNMEYLLNFGSFILLFAILFIVGSLGENQELVKFVMGVVCSLGVIGLSYVVGNNLKMDGSAKLIHVEGCFLISFFYYLAGEVQLFGEWFSLNGDGVNLFFAVLFILISVLLVLTKLRFKDYSFIHASYISSLLAIFNIFKFLSLSYLELSVLLLVIVLLPYIFIKNNSKFNFIRYILIGVMIYSILLVISDDVINVFSISSIVLSIISTSFIAIKSKDIESKYFAIIVYYFLFYVIGSLFDNVVSIDLIYVLIAFCACVVDLALNYCIKYFGSNALKFNKLVYSIFMIFLITGSLSIKYSALLVVAIFVLISSIVIIKVFKDDKVEKFFLPFKIGLFVFSILYFLTNILVEIPSIVCLFVMNVVFLVFYKLSNDNKVKIEYTALIIILLFSSLTINESTSIVNYLVSLFMMLLDYLLLIVGENKDSKILGKLVYVMMVITSLLTLGVYEVGNIKYLVETLFLLILFISNDKVKFNVGITLPLIAVNLSFYIGEVIMNVIVGNILINILWIVTVILFVYYLLSRNKDRDLLLSILLGFIVGSFIIGNSSEMILAIYSISISTMIIIGANRVNFKKLFSVGIGLGVLSLAMLLLSVEGIPASVYLLLLGMGVIGFAIYMISKYQKLENEKVRYCEECGTKLVGKVEQCNNCGKKVVD